MWRDEINNMQGVAEDTIKLVRRAYRMLKQDCYYDMTDLFLRARLSAFEVGHSFEKDIESVTGVVRQLREDKSPQSSRQLQAWLNEISFHCLPKAIKQDNPRNTDELFNSNVRSQASYPIESVNYFIDAPVQLHLLDMLWCLVVGPVIDRDLDEQCLGNRLESADDEIEEVQSGRLFKIFHHQYAKWRDGAIKCAISLLDQKLDVLLVSLDIKQCYYHLPASFDHIQRDIDQQLPASKKVLAHGLTSVVAAMHERYSAEVGAMLVKSHSEQASKIRGLPVGLASSRILANAELNRWDKVVRKKLRPAYYGRYVDDMLVVLASPPEEVIGAIDAVMGKLFINTGLLKPKDGKEGLYRLTMLTDCAIEPSKVIVNYFDHHHSRAGLTEFQREILKQVSEFRFLPIEEGSQSLDECAYDVLYKGSINKLRSVIGLIENSTELSKYLARRLLQYRLCSTPIPEDSVQQLMRFYRGRNMFEFCRLWEKVFTLLLVNRKEKECARFFNEAEKAVGALAHGHADLCDKVKEDTTRYLQLSLAMTVGLHAQDYNEKAKAKRFRVLLNSPELIDAASAFRHANMIRHQLVRYPLINYTAFTGSLIDCGIHQLAGKDLEFLKLKEERSPRYVHPDERALFKYLTEAAKGSFETLLKDDIHAYWDTLSVVSSDAEGANSDTKTFHLKVGDDSAENVCVGIANLKVRDADIERSYNPRKIPNTSFERQAVLYELINVGGRAPKCDLLVFPEVSIPYSWVPFMVAQARRHQMGMVFGVEHLVGSETAYNLLATVLPFRTKGKHSSCFLSLRLKNHYAPEEALSLDRIGLKIPKQEPAVYEKYTWRGMEFASYNCFELTNIRHRGLFRRDVDFLVVVAWNKDVPYYANIIESVARDVHCYIVQANTSQFGDSRVTGPLKNAEMNRIRVSGGENDVLLKAKLDIDGLRDFQSKKYSPDDDRFKPLPAGFDQEKARKRFQKRSVDQ